MHPPLKEWVQAAAINPCFLEPPWLTKRRDPAKFQCGGEYGNLYRSNVNIFLPLDPLLNSSDYVELLAERAEAAREAAENANSMDLRQSVGDENNLIVHKCIG